MRGDTKDWNFVFANLQKFSFSKNKNSLKIIYIKTAKLLAKLIFTFENSHKKNAQWEEKVVPQFHEKIGLKRLVCSSFQSYFDTVLFNFKQTKFFPDPNCSCEGIIVCWSLELWQVFTSLFLQNNARFCIINNPKSLSLYFFLLRSCVSGPHEGLHPLHLRDELPPRHPHLRDIHCC